MTDDTPNEVDNYVLQGLLYLVFVHEEIVHLVSEDTKVSLLSTLSGGIFQAYLETLDLVPSFSEYGMRKVKRGFVVSNQYF
jgi:hypothetical protein